MNIYSVTVNIGVIVHTHIITATAEYNARNAVMVLYSGGYITNCTMLGPA